MTRKWGDEPPPPRRHWSKLPPIRGAERIPDGPNGERRCRCTCGWQGSTLGLALHTMSATVHNPNGPWWRHRK